MQRPAPQPSGRCRGSPGQKAVSGMGVPAPLLNPPFPSDPPQPAMLRHAAAGSGGHGEGKVHPSLCHRAVVTGRWLGSPLEGGAKGFLCLLLCPLPVSRPAVWTTRSKLSVRRTWRRKSTRGERRGSIQPGWEQHPWGAGRGCDPAVGKGHLGLLPTVGEMGMGWRCPPGWGWNGDVLQDGAGTEMFARLGLELGWRCSPGWSWDRDVLQAGPGTEMFSRLGL